MYVHVTTAKQEDEFFKYMDDQNRLVIVIINYKTPELVIGALTSLFTELDLDNDKVVVIDNASNDDSFEKILIHIEQEKMTNWVDVIPSSVNGGFSAGNNIGIKYLQAKYYLLLNSDAWVRRGAIDVMLDAIEQDANIGLVGPRLEWENGEQQVSCFNNVTPWNVFLNVTNTGVITKFFGLFGIHEVAIPTNSNIKSPEWLSFACVLIRGKVIKDIGLMDEKFFMYMEDIDYCRRAREASWTTLFVEDARVVHLNNGYSNSALVRRLPNYYYQSRSRYFIKYYGRFGLCCSNLLWYIGRIISFSREVFQKKKRTVPLYSFVDIWIGFWNKVDCD